MRRTNLRATVLGILVAFMAIPADQADAEIVTFDLTASGESTLGSLLIGSPTAVVGDITFGVSATSTFEGGANFLASTAIAGVDTVNPAAPFDGSSAINSYETLTFTLAFDPAEDVSLVGLDLSGVAGFSDAAFVTIGDNETIGVFFGVDGFDNTPDTYTPAEPIAISNGDSIVFSSNNNYSLQSITLNIGEGVLPPAVPEPSSLALLGLGGVITLVRRRRS